MSVDEDKDKYFKKSELKARSGNMSSFGGPSSVGVRMLTPLMSTSWSLALDGVFSLADHLKGIAHHAKYILQRESLSVDGFTSMSVLRTVDN